VLPDRSTVELKRESVGRINCALVGPPDPNMAGIIDPSSRARFVYEIEVPAVLRDVGKTARGAVFSPEAVYNKRSVAASWVH